MVSFNKDFQVEYVYGNYTTYPKIEQMKAIIDYAKKYIRKHKNEETIEFLNYKAEKEFDEKARKEEADRRSSRPVEKTDSPVRNTNIYLILDTIRGVYKIGKSDNPTSRFNQLKTANAGIQYLCSYLADERCEKVLHDFFREKNVSGEWFAMDDTDIETFHRLFGRDSNGKTIAKTSTEYE